MDQAIAPRQGCRTTPDCKDIWQVVAVALCYLIFDETLLQSLCLLAVSEHARPSDYLRRWKLGSRIYVRLARGAVLAHYLSVMI